MAVRDPGYEWNTNPAYPNAANRAFIDAMLTHLTAIGVEWVRFEFHGSYDGGSYGSINLAQADYFVDAAHARGLKVLALLGTDLLRGTASAVSHFDGGTVSGVIPTSSADRELSPCPPAPIGCGVNPYQQAWLARALDIAEYYQGRIDAYEIFNEPNYYFALRDETGAAQDEMNPHYVAQTITKFYRIRRADGDPTPIIVGGIHPMRSHESGRSDREYINSLYTSSAWVGWFNGHDDQWPIDGIGYHPYPTEMRRLYGDNDFLHLLGPRLDAVIAAIRDHDATARLWPTEIGTRGASEDEADMARQAEFLGQAAALFYSRRADLGPWFWFKYEDFPPASEAWGVVRIPYDAGGAYDVNGTVAIYKPAYGRYQQAAFNWDSRAWLPLIQN